MSRVKRHKLKKSVLRRKPKKKRMSKKVIWTIIIGGIMILSVFGIMFSSYNSGKEEVKHGDYTFIKTTTGWSTEIDGRKAEFSYLPSDVEDFEISKEVEAKLRGSKVIYLTFDPNTKNVQKLELMRFELGNSLKQLFKIYAMPGIMNESEDYNQPLVDCENATAILPVVSIVEANETKAYMDGNCIVLEVNDYSTTDLKDRLLYAVLGII